MTGLSDSQIADFKAAFYIFDTKNRGTIDADDLKLVFESLGEHLSDIDIANILEEIDQQNIGKVDLGKFLKLMEANIGGYDKNDELREAFKFFDVNDSGYLCAEGLFKIMTSLGEKLSKKEAEVMIKEADKAGKGYLTFEDFVKMMSS